MSRPNHSLLPDRSEISFLGDDLRRVARCDCRYALVPVPWEATVSWGTGTADGPRALLDASQYVELWDEELRTEAWTAGIYTYSPIALPPIEEELPAHHEVVWAAVEAIHRTAAHILAEGHRTLFLGGEHGITPPLVRAALEHFGDLAVVQFDAHADLRQTYHGTPWSHACAMARVRDLGVEHLAVGIRSLTPEGARRIDDEGFPVLWADPLLLPPNELEERFREALKALPESIYLTFDVDWFDPSELPATGTPEPGGGDWFGALRLLRILFEEKRVVAGDVVELAPHPEHAASDFLVAKLVYKMIGYWQKTRPSV